VDRRSFIGRATSAFLVVPLAARAQKPAIPIIGFLNSRAAGDDPHLLTAFRQGLKEVGYVEGQNVAIEYRFADGQDNRLPALAADLIRRHVAVIAANGLAAQAAKAATATIPIVFTAGFDPVEVGLVVSMSRPGGNITGVSVLDVELGPKRLELLHALVPTATIIAVLVNPTDPARAETITRNMEAEGRNLGLQLQILHASTDRDFDAVFARLVQLRTAGLVIGGDPFFNSRAERLGALTLRHAVPAIYQFREFATAGGLASYGANLTDSYRLTGVYTGRILRGEKPGDLPIQRATKVELVINQKTAKALGLTLPQSLLLRADEVIQ
jgi:putative ABC transport system substrate-binding protein